jgi:hypothetical protein
MTRERAKELAPIIQAYGEGKVCEWQMSNGSWSETAVLECMDGRNYRIKPEPKTRPMTRGEVLYVLSTEHCVVRFRDQEAFLYSEAVEEDVTIEMFMEHLQEYKYAIIDKHGEPVDGWHKFEIEE